MSPAATAANVAWAAASVPAYARFRRALAEPERVQRAKLCALLAANCDSAFGREHGYDRIANHADFTARVPLARYEDLEPWIARIMRGESRVLTTEPVRRLVPTSGSSGPRKLIPFTAGLQREFNAAIGPWMVDLFRTDRALMCGPAYWSVSPLAREENSRDESAVPIGFDDDAGYLGGARRKLVGAAMAVPSSVRALRDVAAFRRATLLHLLRCPDLRLISVWHPSFLALLLDELIATWHELVRETRRDLARADPRRPETIWPRLRLISCWADGHATLGAEDLARRFPNVRVQAKGLLATEAFVTLPFARQHPLAITSHFFEFVRDDDSVVLAHELHEGEDCEVVVTTAGGLWRYRLRDRVVVDGFVARTPSLRFIGRTGNVSDRRGEKLSEEFVARVLRDLLGAIGLRFALVAPDEDEKASEGYTLFIESDSIAGDLAQRLDATLRANPHYAWCRDLGQLRAARVFRIERGGYETYTARAMEQGQRLGDIKPTALSRESGWSRLFAGAYADGDALRFVSRPTMSPSTAPSAMPPRP